MKNLWFKLWLAGLIFLVAACGESTAPPEQPYDIIIVGGGASGTMAGIQAARMGKKTLILEETQWLGGMLTSAGVSAIDGNYRLHSGLWEEFRNNLYEYYGGEDSVKTGWVSNVLFEPQVGAEILLKMASQIEKLETRFQTRFNHIEQLENGWKVWAETEGKEEEFQGKILIDGTELGDVAKAAGVLYDIGMDARSKTGEDIAPEKGNDIIQDLTYVAVLEEFAEGTDKTIPKPEGYDESLFYCTCDSFCPPDGPRERLWNCDQMMNYGRLPNGKVMINWPISGNDYYLNAIEASRERRQDLFEEAKWFTKCYVYYLQTKLGYRHYGIAENIFPTEDDFPMIPYHRESRRIKGVVQFTLNDLARPYEQDTRLYRTGIAVGDYPVDHHHNAYPEHESLPDLHFYPVPSYALPLGTLIPAEKENLIVAEKSISVTNIVNGTTRLQPVCILIGQAAGVLAALAVENNLSVREVPVRMVQEALLQAEAMILPYVDVEPADPAFQAVQRIGATGILKGEGKNVGWSNLTLFHPDSVVLSSSAGEGLKELGIDTDAGIEYLSIEEAYHIAHDLNETINQWYPETRKKSSSRSLEEIWADFQFGELQTKRPVTRKEFAGILDTVADPFRIPVDHQGIFKGR